jgi:hypothetical protein
MIDLYLDPVTHDLVLEDFTLKATPTLQEQIIQRLKVKLLWFQGEWFLDETYGMPYYQEIFVSGFNKEVIDDIFRLAISTEKGVTKLIKYSSTFTPTTRTFAVSAKIQIEGGEVMNLNFTI